MGEHGYMSKELEVSRTGLQGSVALPTSTWSAQRQSWATTVSMVITLRPRDTQALLTHRAPSLS